jgi:hypothetical protein
MPPPLQPFFRAPIPRHHPPQTPQVTDTCHPYWRCLADNLEYAAGESKEGEGLDTLLQALDAAFEPARLAAQAHAMPASVLSAVVAGMGSRVAATPVRGAMMRFLSAALHALAGAAAAGAPADGDLTPSQLVWAAPRIAPVRASLAELCREPELLPALAACAARADAGVAEHAAASAALDVAVALLGSDETRELLLEGGNEVGWERGEVLVWSGKWGGWGGLKGH